MAYYIEKFSSYLCLVHATDESTMIVDFSSFDLPENTEDVIKSINSLYECCPQEFKAAVDHILGADDWKSFQFYMKAVISRCVKISTHTAYLHFLLVCTLIRETIFSSFCLIECFTFAKIGSQCLAAVYDRCYKATYDNIDLPEILAAYCRNLNLYLVHVPRGIFHQQVSFLLASLGDVDDMNFELTDFEKEMLRNTLISVQGEDFFDDISKSSLSSSDNDTSSDNSVEYMDINEDNACRANRVCCLCGGKCFNFVLSCED